MGVSLSIAAWWQAHQVTHGSVAEYCCMVAGVQQNMVKGEKAKEQRKLMSTNIPDQITQWLLVKLPEDMIMAFCLKK